MKKSVWLFAILVMGLLFGCQNNAAEPSTALNAGTGSDFRVALLLPRPVDADSWTRAGYEGLLAIQNELGAEIAYRDNIAEADFEQVFREYAEAGYDFIIGHGNQFTPAAEIVAQDYPLIDFAIAGHYAGNNVNLGALSLREGEMAYLMGAIAAIKSETRHVGYIGGSDNASQQETIALYQRGVADIDSRIEITIDMIGNFTDSERAEALAAAQINDGVDVILVIAGMAGNGIHMQAQEAGIFTLAWVEDMNYLAPQAVISSNVQNVPMMLLEGARLSQQGLWEGKQYKFGMAEGVQHLAPFYGLLSPEQAARVEQIETDIITERINTLP